MEMGSVRTVVHRKQSDGASKFVMNPMNRNHYCAFCGGKVVGKPIWKPVHNIHSGGVDSSWRKNSDFYVYCSPQCIDNDCDAHKRGERVRGKWVKSAVSVSVEECCYTQSLRPLAKPGRDVDYDVFRPPRPEINPQEYK